MRFEPGTSNEGGPLIISDEDIKLYVLHHPPDGVTNLKYKL